MGQDLIKNEKYYALVDEIRSTITEAVTTSRWVLVEGYWIIGKLIREYFIEGQLTKQLQGLAVDVGMSERILWYALQFYDKYPDLNTVPEGKNITWNKIITKYLTTSKVTETTVKEYWIKCPNCGHKFTMEKYHVI